MLLECGCTLENICRYKIIKTLREFMICKKIASKCMLLWWSYSILCNCRGCRLITGQAIFSGHWLLHKVITLLNHLINLIRTLHCTFLFSSVPILKAIYIKVKNAPNLFGWGRVTHICVCNLTNIGSDNGLLPVRRQAIIWTNAGILLIGPLGTNFSEILSEIRSFLFKKTHLKMSSAKWRPFCLGLNVLRVPLNGNLHSVTTIMS